MADSKGDVTPPKRRGRPAGRRPDDAQNRPGFEGERLGTAIPGSPVGDQSDSGVPPSSPQQQGSRSGESSPEDGTDGRDVTEQGTPGSGTAGAAGSLAAPTTGKQGKKQGKKQGTAGDADQDAAGSSGSSRSGRTGSAMTGAARGAMGGGGLKGAASGAATGAADGQPKQGERVDEDGKKQGPGAKESAKTIAAETTKGAAQGGAAAAATGGTSALAGAAKGAAKGTAKAIGRSPKGRKAFVAVVVLLFMIPLILPLAIGATMGGLVSALAQGEQENVSSDAVMDDVGEGFEGDDIDIRMFRDAVDGTDTPWQVLMALHQVSSGGLEPSGGGGGGGIADVVEPDDMTCPSTDLSAEEGLTANALLVLRCGANEFDDIETWFGVGERSNNPKSDHPNGRAVDIMIPDWDSPVGNARGWTIARWAAANSDALGIKYVIFDAQIWTGGATWDTYSHPSGSSNPTVDHLDHVHVSVVDEGGQPASPGGAGSSGDGSGGSSSSGGGGRGPFDLNEDADLTDEQADDPYMAGRYVASELSSELNSLSREADVSLGSGTIRDEEDQLHLALPTSEHSPDDDDDADDTDDEGSDSDDDADDADDADDEGADADDDADDEDADSGADDEGSDSDDDADDDGDSGSGTTGEESFLYDDDLVRDAAATQDVYIESINKLPIDGMDEGTAEDVFEVSRNWYMGLPGQLGDGEVCVISGGGESVSALESTNGLGQTISLSSKQLGYAAIVIGVAEERSHGEDGAKIALMTAMQESTLLNYANNGTHSGLTASESATVRESLSIDNDAIGSDWDSVGIFQARPSMGWGSVKEIMDPEYTSGRFFDALEGVSGWESMDYGTAAQRVQRSAFPDAYDKWEPVASDILANVSGAACAPSQGEVSAEGWANPLPGSFISSPFSLARRHPITGQLIAHRGVDLAAPLGSEIFAAQDGVVIKKGGCATQGCSISDPDYWITGLFVAVDHGGLVTTYNHIKAGSPVKVGDEVKAGDHIANVGLTGGTTGPHLHFQVMPDKHDWVDPVPYLAERGIDLG